MPACFTFHDIISQHLSFTAPHTYTEKGRYTMAVRVIGIFGNDTMTRRG
jgi:hypothetical protein